MSARGQQASSPASPQRELGFPSNEGIFIFEGFSGLNTKSLRPAIKDDEMAISDGWMPIGPNNARTLYGIGPALYTAPTGKTIGYFNFWNLASTPITIVVLSDGSILQVNTNTGMQTTIAPAGTILNPEGGPDTVGWGSQYIAICALQTNGYWVWDGTSFYSAGSIGPDVDMTNSGSNYSSQPTFTVLTTGAGTGATFNATISNGSIDSIQVTDPGSGFANGDFAVLALSGGGSDTTATATATVSPTTGGVSTVAVTNPGASYPANTTITATGGGGTGATFFIQSASGGGIYAIGVLTPGTGYTSPPTIVATGSGGSGFAATATIAFGEISGVSIVDDGTDYLTNPTVTVIGDGTGAVVTPQINSSGNLASLTVTNSGSGYTVALIQISGGNNAASATLNLMPFGVSGSAIETYAGHVWIANGPEIIFSAPDSVSDFDPSNGGGAFTSTDSFLNIGYIFLKQSNGFLYLLADSSLSYISGVSTSGTPAITTFQNQNVDPQIGSPWHGTGQVFSRNIVFGNALGVYVSYGGAVTKISAPLDGIYNSVPGFGSFQPSSAVTNIFGIEVYMQLTPVIDQYTGQQVNKLLMWDGQKWFTSQQEVNLLYIASQKINSVLTAWGTDGRAIYPLFQQPSVLFQKVIQSKLWSSPHYLYTKTGIRLYGVLNYYQNDGEAVSITVDNENTEAMYSPTLVSNVFTWTTPAGAPFVWTVGSGVFTWTTGGLTVFGPEAVAQQGRMLGMTVVTNASDLALISTSLMDQTYMANV